MKGNLKLLRSQARVAMVYLDVAAGLVDMYPTDLAILSCLWDAKTATAGELARMVNLSSGAATAAIDRLERAGFVSREADLSDRRKVVVRFEKIPAKFEKIQKMVEDEWEKMFNDYNDKEMARVVAMMDQANDVLKNIIEEIYKSEK